MAQSDSTRPRGASEIFGTVPFCLKRHVSPHGQVTAVSMMKDEGPFVIEWVAHHLAVGFTDLIVFTNDCSDGTDDMLIRLEELGLAHHRRNVIPEGIRPQPSALNHAEEDELVQQSDWVLVFDADEFVSIRYGDGTLDDLIGAASETGANGIVMTWRIFGSGGVVDWSRAPVTEQYLMAAPPDWNKGWGVKTLFRYDPEYWRLGIHRPKLKNKHIKSGFPDDIRWINGSGREMPEYFKFRGWRSIIRTVGYDWVQLNHYAVKSVDSYALRKLRGNVNNKADKYNSGYWSLQDRNEVRDDTMLRYTEKRNAIMAGLLTDPVLNRLHFAAVERAETRLTVIRATPEYAELRDSLLEAGKMPISEVVAAPPKPRDAERIRALMSDVEKQRNDAAKEKRRESAEALPESIFVSRPVSTGSGYEGEWFASYGIELPPDPQIFSDKGLRLIRKGKFDRALVRALPADLPQSARLLEIGANIGFLGLYLARTRPDLEILVQEDDTGLSAAREMIHRRNGSGFRPGFSLLEDRLGETGPGLAALVGRVAPDALILADPRLTPEHLDQVLAAGSSAPKLICLHGRLVEAQRDRLEEFAGLFEAAGYQPNTRVDPAVTMGRIRRDSQQ